MEREIQHTHHHNPHLIHLSISVHSVMQYETHVKWRFSIINSSRCYSNFRLHLYPHPHPLPHHPPYCSLPHPARLVFIESRILRWPPLMSFNSSVSSQLISNRLNSIIFKQLSRAWNFIRQPSIRLREFRYSLSWRRLSKRNFMQSTIVVGLNATTPIRERVAKNWIVIIFQWMCRLPRSFHPHPLNQFSHQPFQSTQTYQQFMQAHFILIRWHLSHGPNGRRMKLSHFRSTNHTLQADSVQGIPFNKKKPYMAM